MGSLERAEGGWRLTGRWHVRQWMRPFSLVHCWGQSRQSWARRLPHAVTSWSRAPMSSLTTRGTRWGCGERAQRIWSSNGAFIPEHRAVPTWPTFLGLSPHAKAPVYRLSVYSGLPAMLSGSVLGYGGRRPEGLRRSDSHARQPLTASAKAKNPTMQRACGRIGRGNRRGTTSFDGNV